MSATTPVYQPTSKEELRTRLIGAWKLESYVHLAMPP
jgi:hypothetical protein